MSQRYAEALTLKEAISKALIKQSNDELVQFETRSAQNCLEQTLINHLLVRKGKLGAFNFADAISPWTNPFVGEGNLSFSLALAKLRPNAAQQLTRDGIVCMTVVDNPFYEGAFSLPTAARFAGLRALKFTHSIHHVFPDIVTPILWGDQSALARHHSFRTWVFR